MHWQGWVVVALAGICFGWMLFDGCHALTTGDFVTPSSGDYAGQLGPWSKVVRLVGIEPRSTLMKRAHVALGALGLIATISFALRLPWGWGTLLALAIAVLWYLPFGTVLGTAQIALLLWIRSRSS